MVFQDIMHIKINNVCKSAILYLINLKNFKAYPSLKSHILLYTNCLAIWHSFPDITVVIRYNTIGVVHKYESCYKPIVLYKMVRFYLVLLGTILSEIHRMR